MIDKKILDLPDRVMEAFRKEYGILSAMASKSNSTDEYIRITFWVEQTWQKAVYSTKSRRFISVLYCSQGSILKDYSDTGESEKNSLLVDDKLFCIPTK